MPEVGVLNLTIRDNASEAAKGLGQLEKKLAGVKAAAEGYDLSTVSTQISNLISTAKGSEKATAALGTLMNAVSDYHKTFAKLGNVELNLTPIEKIKSALEGGINIGNAGTQINKIREAMSGEWNTANAESASTVLSTIATGAKELVGAGLNTAAKNISALAKSIGDVSIAIGGMQASGLSGFAGLMSGGIGEANSTGANVALGVKEGIESERDALINSAIQMAVGAVMAMKQALDIHSPSGVTEGEVGTPMGQGVAEGLMQTESTIQNAAVEVVQNAVSAMRSEVEQSTIDLSKIPAMSSDGGFANVAEEIKFVSAELDKSRENIKFWSDTYDSTMRGIKYAGATEDRTNMLGHAEEGFYQAVEQAETYEAALNAINGYVQAYIKNEQSAAQATNEHADGLARVNSVIQESTGLMQSSQQSAKGYYASLEDAFNGIRRGQVTKNDLMSSWLHGNGTEKEQLFALQTMAKEFSMTIDEVKAKIAEFIAKENELKGETSSLGDSTQNIIDIDKFIEAYNHADYLKNKIIELKQVLQERMALGDIGSDEIDSMVSKIQKLQTEYDKLSDAENNAEEASFSLGDAFGVLKGAMHAMFPTLSKLLERFSGMAKMRAMRYIIRQIAAGFKEGVQNVYEYSKAVGGSFAPSMDSAASALAQMRNSLGAALAPALQSIIPILNTVISWFITAINYVNQFFALLRGQASWTRAVPQTTSAFDKQTKAAKGAGAAMKDLLADWDELNIIQSQSGGGGGGGASSAAEDYLNMFEEMYTFDSKIKDTVNWIKDNFETIKTIAEGIGAAIMLWRLSSAFGKDLSLLQKLELAAGLTLMITGIKISAAAGYDIGVNGLNGENALEAVKGILATAFGGGLVGLAFAGIYGGVVGLGIGAALGIAVLSLNIHKGQLDSLYGDVNKDIDEIRKELEEGILTIDARAQIEVTHAKLTSLSLARTAVSSALHVLTGAYPVAVEINPDNKEAFKKKVDDLVKETNALIETHTDVMTELYVPATAKFDDNFISKAWGDVKDTVTGLGEEIGKELSKSIVDSTRVDELKKKLMALSEAVMNAQYRGEFSGKVGVAGSKTRENTRLGIFNRETIQNYIDEYNKITDEAKAEAEARAVAERAEAETLVASLKGSLDIVKSEVEDAKDKGLQGTPEYRELINRQKEIEADLKIAREELNAWEKGDRYNQRVKELYDEWTRGGRTVYAHDIADALSLAISKNDKVSSKFSMFLDQKTTPRDREITDSDKWTRHYIESQKRGLYDLIAQASGMNVDSVKKMISESGINPLSLFDSDFVKQYQDKIADWLGQSNLSNERKASILSAFGLDMNYLKQFMKQKEELEQQAIEKRRKDEEKARKEEEARAKETYETVKGIVNEKIGSGIQGNEIDNLYRDLLLNYDQGAVDRVWAEIVERLPETKVPVEIEPAVEKNKTDETEEAIRKAIQNGIDAGYDPSQMDALLASLVGKYQLPDLIDEIFEELENGPSGIGTADVNYTPAAPAYVSTGTAEGLEMEATVDNENFATDVETGVTAGNKGVVDALQTAISYLMRIAAKDFSVTVVPTTSLGATNAAAAGMLGKVNGF